ncbi:MAG: hypothetical protein ABIQ51_04610 [Mesorhizobium sp.]
MILRVTRSVVAPRVTHRVIVLRASSQGDAMRHPGVTLCVIATH